MSANDPIADVSPRCHLDRHFHALHEANDLPFQPFGYRFDVSSNFSPAEAKKLIRSEKTGIFDARNGARGWIAGPFICLWFSAFDRYGPMLFGLIVADNFGTRVHGRAGSDLNGVLMFTLMVPLMVWLVFMMVAEGQATARQLIVIALVFLVGGPIMYWSAHKERKDAEPLVRFLRKALTQPTARFKSAEGTPNTNGGLRLILNGDFLEEPVTQEAIQSALLRVGNRDFLIIEADEQNYLQTACGNGQYVLEVRRGGPSDHYQGVRSTARGRDQDDKFTHDEVSAAMGSYIAGEPLPSFVRLRRMNPNK